MTIDIRCGCGASWFIRTEDANNGLVDACPQCGVKIDIDWKITIKPFTVEGLVEGLR